MGRRCSVPWQRARVVASSTSRCTSSVPGAVSSRLRVAGCSMAPPPRARTSASPAARAAMAACSRSRKAASPWRENSSAMVTPASASMASSTSTNFQPRRRATSGPTVVLPEPMKPVRTMRRGTTDVASDWCWPVMEFFAASKAASSSQYMKTMWCSRTAQPSTMTTAPAVMSRPPTTAGAFSFSPSSSQAKSMTSGTLSLSSGATREAGPNCRARK